MIKIYYDYYHFVLSPLATANEHVSFSSLNRNPFFVQYFSFPYRLYSGITIFQKTSMVE